MAMTTVTVEDKEYLVFGGGYDVNTLQPYRDVYIATIDQGQINIEKTDVHLSVVTK